MKVEAPAVIDRDAFAKAGEILKKFKDGEIVDLTPCGQVAAVLGTARKQDGFIQLCEADQARLKAAAASVRAKFGKNQSQMLNFLDQAFGAMRKPAKLEQTQRELIGTFLINVAAAA